ncbi:Origin recognition complex subunit 2 [Blastocladiella emersonii ATCC 22665]|nr:Origin recognition complex subunit 2 [Blastocladiella emersonii ATCC 22665]
MAPTPARTPKRKRAPAAPASPDAEQQPAHLRSARRIFQTALAETNRASSSSSSSAAASPSRAVPKRPEDLILDDDEDDALPRSSQAQLLAEQATPRATSARGSTKSAAASPAPSSQPGAADDDDADESDLLARHRRRHGLDGGFGPARTPGKARVRMLHAAGINTDEAAASPLRKQVVADDDDDDDEVPDTPTKRVASTRKRTASVAALDQTPPTKRAATPRVPPKTPAKTPAARTKTPRTRAVSPSPTPKRVTRSGAASAAASARKTPARGSRARVEAEVEEVAESEEEEVEEVEEDELAGSPKPPRARTGNAAANILFTAAAAERREAAAAAAEEHDDGDGGVDRFFEEQSTTKVLTSDNTLASLPSLTHREYLEAVDALDADTHSNLHAGAIAALHALHRRCFAQWTFELSQGFNLLFLGYGSKYALVSEFVSAALADTHDVVTVTGFHPLASAKSLLATLSTALECPAPSGLADHTLAVTAALDTHYSPADPLVLVVHNIDAPALRSADRAQPVLGALAAHPHVRLIATADHIQTPLAWDFAQLARFAWAAHHVATFAAYSRETAFENALMVQKGATTPAAVVTVLASLPANSAACFALLARDLLAQHKQDGQVAGMAYPTWFARCREQFLVNEEASFRTVVAEFRDHHVVAARRVDGVEMLTIALPPAAIEAVLERINQPAA